MAEKKTTKKAVAKKAAPKKAAAKRTTATKPVAKKASSPAPKKQAVKKAVVKKAAVKKTAVKKTTVKKAAVKKAAVKKASVKKSTAKKATSSRVTAKVDARPTASARISTAAILDTPVRTQRIPEVPIRREVKATVAPITSPTPKVEVSNPSNTSMVTQSATSRSSSKQSRKDRHMLIAAAIIIVIAGVVAFAVPSSNQNSAADGSSQPTVEASPTPSGEATMESQPSPSATASDDAAASRNFDLRFTYNSIGITLNFASAQQFGAVKEYVVKYSENGRDSKILGTFGGQTPSARISKIDTVGKTIFSVDAVLTDGTKVSSSPLAIRGLFAGE